MLTPGEVVGDRFEVDEMIGRGGLSAVFRVRHRQLGGVYALKLLLLHRPEIARRLLLEGQIQSRLRHPNLLAVSDVVDHRGNLGLVMEYVEPPNLAEYLADSGPMPVDLALRLFGPVLSALIAAHDAGVLHRDLKPANVLLARAQGGVIPKIADFGIAKMHMEDADTGATMAGLPMGTPGYMPPEQIRDARSVDHRADLFALGATLFEMLTGRRPFEGDTADLLMVRTLSGMRGELGQIRPDCPPAVIEAVERVLSPEPEDRFPDGRAFGAALFQDHPDLFDALDAPDGRAVPLDMSRWPATLPLDAPSQVRPRPSPSRPGLADYGGLSAPTLPQGALEALPTVAPEPAPRSSRMGLAVAAAGVVVLLVGLGLWGLVTPSGTTTEAPPAEPAPTGDATPGGQTLPVASAGSEGAPPAPPVEAAASPVASAPASAPGSAARPGGAAASTTASNGGTTAAGSTASSAEAPSANPAADAPPTEGDAVAMVEPSSDPAPAEPASSATADPSASDGGTSQAPAPEAPSYPSMVGEWTGTANGRTMTLSIKSQSGAAFKGRVSIQLGAGAEDWPVEGRISEDGSFSFTEMGGPGLTFTGRVSGGAISGAYGRGSNQKLKWSASR